MGFYKDVKQTIENAKLLISSDEEAMNSFNMHIGNLLSFKEGDMYAYLESFSNSLSKINSILKDKGFNTFDDLVDKYKNEKDQLERIQINDYEIGKRYNSYQICAIGRNNNIMLGMHYVKENEEFIVIKATTDGSGKYPNEWLNETTLKYYLRADKNAYNESVFNTKPNQILRDYYKNKKEIDILCFTRDSKKEQFICQGLFKLRKLVIGEDAYWIEIEKKHSNMDSKKFENELSEYKDDLNMMNEINNIQETDIKNYKDTIRKAPKPVVEGNRVKYSRNPKVTKKALVNANYRCEYDDLITFTCESTNNNYVEGHHLIPICKQGEFEYDIDNTANVVALCPKCHMLLHHAKFSEKKVIIEKLYSKREKALKELKIPIKLDKLLDYYR